MTAYEGSCHCGAVRFRVTAEPTRLLECDCSVCTKKGIVHIPVQDQSFELLAGDDALSLYQWKSLTAKHWFCKHCGIHPFGRPRADPSRYTINARCLDDFEALRERLETVHFDGKNHPKDAPS